MAFSDDMEMNEWVDLEVLAALVSTASAITLAEYHTRRHDIQLKR